MPTCVASTTPSNFSDQAASPESTLVPNIENANVGSIDPAGDRDCAIDSTLEADHVLHPDRRKTSFSSEISLESVSTVLTAPDSDSASDAFSEPDSIFDKNTETSSISEARTWDSQSMNSGDHSVNSLPSLPVVSEISDLEMSDRDDYRYIPNLDDVAASRDMDHDPAPGTKSHLPCPFQWDGCEVRFDIQEKKKWIFHSLVHFRAIPPPAHLICPYGDCPERFVDENRIVNWNNRMEHYAGHVQEKLERLRQTIGWAEDDDLDVESMGILELPEKIDLNFQQYMVHHGANRIGLDLRINPNPPSELDNIPPGYMNRMRPAYGGPRFREVVYPPFEDPVEENLDSRSAGVMFISDSRRTGMAAKVLTARTSGDASSPFQRQLPRHYNVDDRSLARQPSERILRK